VKVARHPERRRVAPESKDPVDPERALPRRSHGKEGRRSVALRRGSASYNPIAKVTTVYQRGATSWLGATKRRRCLAAFCL